MSITHVKFFVDDTYEITNNNIIRGKVKVSYLYLSDNQQKEITIDGILGKETREYINIIINPIITKYYQKEDNLDRWIPIKTFIEKYRTGDLLDCIFDDLINIEYKEIDFSSLEEVKDAPSLIITEDKNNYGEYNMGRRLIKRLISVLNIICLFDNNIIQTKVYKINKDNYYDEIETLLLGCFLSLYDKLE